MTKMTKQATLELLQKQLPGFYSVTQVIEVINNIEDGGSFDEDQLETLIDKVTQKVENRLNRMGSDDFVQLDTAEFELNGNEISVTDIEVNTDTIIDEVSDAVRDVLTEFFPAPQEA